ncbi:Uncharacterized protein FWK35_00010496 [Aphis craccivora]|uniref:Uncharacterized protein n=1 Tax=Aphis craccivora TaxID=307492 RepID=A0A6G0YZL6_APHCR|nr:Uncharacterized protein FWK35_00010496 [Aphis craccivora]
MPYYYFFFFGSNPAWTYGLQLWGNAKKTNINKIHTFQNISLRKLVNAPPYVSNHTIHTDLKMPSVSKEAKACINVSISTL